MQADELIRGLLVLLSWRDGYSNGANGMIAIQQVVANRVKAGYSGGDWVSVIWGLLKLDGLPLCGPDPRDPVIQQALQAVDHVYSGQIVDKLTNGATAYTVDADHAIKVAALGFQRTAVVGTLTFWKKGI